MESEILSQVKKDKYDCLLFKYDRSLDTKQLKKYLVELNNL